MNRLSAYARLVRLPNVFTACADISVGVLAGHVPVVTAISLFGTTACLYSAGMAFNDYFDRDIDAIERPQRPIPHGAIAPSAAFGLAMALTTIAIAISVTIGIPTLVHAVVLIALILAYNAGLKATILGPLVMGGCRFTNVFLSFSSLTTEVVDWPMRFVAAGIVGFYIVGVTLFARSEVGRSRSGILEVAAAICAVAVAASAMVPAASSSLHPYLGAALLLILSRRAINAIADPSPRQVQRFVKAAIFGLIALDATLALALAGPVGLCVLLWLIPAVILGRWLYST